MDGFSQGWGFSWGDEFTNLLGASLAVGQEAVWNEQKIRLKFSYHKSGLAEYRPSLLGKNAWTRVLKDYNGQTYWASVNPFAFSKRKNRFPPWLNLSIGYGAYGMLEAHPGTLALLDVNGNVIKTERIRKFYLSLDIDFSRIKTKSRALKALFHVLNTVKFPAPAIEFSKKGIRAVPLFY
jgi:hypothetical protein